MAHQAHVIPWHLLAANFEYAYDKTVSPEEPTDRVGGYGTGKTYELPEFLKALSESWGLGSWGSGSGSISNLYLRPRPGAAADLTHFVDAFATAIREAAERERRKFPEVYDVPKPDEVVISDEVVTDISPTISLYGVLEAKGYHACGLARDEWWTMASFLHAWEYGHICYEVMPANRAAYAGHQIVEALLLHGQMDAILRICSHPGVDLMDWEERMSSNCGASVTDLGWAFVYKNALAGYLCLNLLYCYPELWDPGRGRSELRDYRLTRGYQAMLQKTTGAIYDDIGTGPHRLFFGIMDGQLKANKEGYPCGQMRIEDFLTFHRIEQRDRASGCFHQVARGFLPTPQDVRLVRALLLGKGLPVEIALDILESADYRPQRLLRIPDDPLHKDNRKELLEYLDYCWQLLIRCDIMATALRGGLNWKHLVSYEIASLWLSRKDWELETQPDGLWGITFLGGISEVR